MSFSFRQALAAKARSKREKRPELQHENKDSGQHPDAAPPFEMLQKTGSAQFRGTATPILEIAF
ncbi:hypothetical protein [Paracoccus fistulariae]|uniref:Uncharacterized protein n=1 Tax=Paracoccus fistulariae TaxID=658446 RepID=A0ABY7SHE4_9RHOB|nr:hypothetical protein [Paracoccus fistulariae]MDB6181029.1 hypothetical protein [Paracoccus fistulariae]WCR06325.1 hypothetical protein JHX87_12565 [Paracoccus fistulariae]